MNVNIARNQINFGKTLVAKCDLPRQNHSKVACNIYQLNLDEDRDYFQKLEKSKSWKDGSYVWEMNDEFNSEVEGERTYVIESKAGRCLGYIVMQTDYEDQTEDEIVYLETCPKYQTKNSTRSLQYIGETLISFVVGGLDKSKTNAVIIKAYSKTGKPFYINNCGFKEVEDRNNALILNKNNFKTLLNKNEQHTNSKIQYVV